MAHRDAATVEALALDMIRLATGSDHGATLVIEVHVKGADITVTFELPDQDERQT
jgi:hypothetical protein